MAASASEPERFHRDGIFIGINYMPAPAFLTDDAGGMILPKNVDLWLDTLRFALFQKGVFFLMWVLFVTRRGLESTAINLSASALDPVFRPCAEFEGGFHLFFEATIRAGEKGLSRGVHSQSKTCFGPKITPFAFGKGLLFSLDRGIFEVAFEALPAGAPDRDVAAYIFRDIGFLLYATVRTRNNRIPFLIGIHGSHGSQVCFIFPLNHRRSRFIREGSLTEASPLIFASAWSRRKS